MTPTEAISIFVHRVLKCEGMDAEQVARHEAGHRLMWRVAFPDVRTHYEISQNDDESLPSVVRDDGRHNIKIDEMTVEEASRYAYVKLGGIASEMLWLGLSDFSAAIAEWVAGDVNAEFSRIDWKDDAMHGGDIPQAVELIGGKAGWDRDILRRNLATIIGHCIAIMRDEEEAYRDEVVAAMRFVHACIRHGHLAWLDEGGLLAALKAMAPAQQEGHR